MRDLDNRHRSSNQSLIIVPEVENDEYLMKSDTGVCMYLYIQTHTHTYGHLNHHIIIVLAKERLAHILKNLQPTASEKRK